MDECQVTQLNGATVGEAHGIYFQYVQTRTSPMGGAQGAYRRDGFPGYECLTTQAFTSLKVPVEVFQPLRQLPTGHAAASIFELVAIGTISNPIGNTDPKCVPCSRKVHPKKLFCIQEKSANFLCILKAVLDALLLE